MKQLCETQVTYGVFRFSDYTKDVVVTDGHIAELYGIAGDNVYLLPRGEQAKSLDNVVKLCKLFLARNLTPSDRVVAVGGGSIGDTVGFACSIFKRGVNLLHVPTTLVAMIDSSIGGKTGVDFDGVKNLLGTYCFADALIDIAFLKTLDAVQTKSGMGELLKYRMIDESVNNACVEGSSFDDIIVRCIETKRNICFRDPYCKGERNRLNFGHTVGHAMELKLGIPHGIAVANGIYYETLLARKMELCTANYAEYWTTEVKNQFEIYPLAEQMLDLTLFDKKNSSSKVTFCLPSDFGSRELELETVKRLLLDQPA